MENLTVAYGSRRVVQGISFRVDAGEILGLLGPSGAGKSSVLAAITGVVEATGAIRHGDAMLSAYPARQRGFGHVYQEFRLFEWMSIWDNVAFPCRANQWDAAETEIAVRAALKRVGLIMSPDISVRALSGGERQRVALARALVFRPRALLLDEPFSHLDPPLRAELKLDLIRFLNDNPIPAILVTHDYVEAFELCDRIAVILEGRLIQSGSVDDLLESPANTDVARLLGYSNSFAGTVAESDSTHVVIHQAGLSTTMRGRWVGRRPTVGERVIALFRTESPRVSTPSTENDNVLRGLVIDSHNSLSGTVVTIQFTDSSLATVRLQSHVNLVSGQTVNFAIPPDDLIVFGQKES